MRKLFFIPIVLLVLFAGCKIADDYKLGKTTPLAADEVSPQAKAQTYASAVSSIPYVNIASPFLLLGLPYVFTWLRGRNIRLSTLPVNPNPITGALGKNIQLESVVQHIADVAAGLFEVGPNGSVLRHGWQTALLAGLGVTLAPVVQNFISSIVPSLQSNPPAWLHGAALALAVGGLGAVQKWLSKVEPLTPPVSPAVIPAL